MNSFMNKTILHFILSSCILLCMISCSKDGKRADFSNIHMTDAVGNHIGGDTTDGQWHSTAFTAAEMRLFNELDTASLIGTVKPDIVRTTYAYPNPFSNQFNVSISTYFGFNGQMVVKYVIVNRFMQALQKGVMRFNGNSYATFAISSTRPPGKYRLYFTLSAEGHNHFYKSWGNIQQQ